MKPNIDDFPEVTDGPYEVVARGFFKEAVTDPGKATKGQWGEGFFNISTGVNYGASRLKKKGLGLYIHVQWQSKVWTEPAQ